MKPLFMYARVLLVLIAVPALFLQAKAQGEEGSAWLTIENGSIWYDEQGDTVQAHAPGFVYYEGRFYMVGEDRARAYNPDVNLYSSADLVHWRFEKKIVENGVTHPELGRTRMIERPKLLHCPQTGNFVLWCHWEAADYSACEAAVFQSSDIAGEYSLVWAGRPMGIRSRDCNVFQDADGTAYFVSTTSIHADNGELGIFRLADDYLSVTGHTLLFDGKHREAPAIVRIGDTYWMLNSGTTGWEPNQCQLSHSKSMDKGWTPLENVGNHNTFDTQAAAILTLHGTETTTYLYVGDRWKDPTLPESKIILFPLTFENGTCQMHYRERFQLNLTTGAWRDVPEAPDTP